MIYYNCLLFQYLMLSNLFWFLYDYINFFLGVAWAVPSVSVTWTSSSGSAPDFAEPMGNVTVPVGREAVLSCTVSNLGQYKVRLNVQFRFIEQLVSINIFDVL